MTAGAGIACTRTVRAGSAQLFLSHGVTDNAASLAAAGFVLTHDPDRARPEEFMVAFTVRQAAQHES